MVLADGHFSQCLYFIRTELEINYKMIVLGFFFVKADVSISCQTTTCPFSLVANIENWKYIIVHPLFEARKSACTHMRLTYFTCESFPRHKDLGFLAGQID